MPDTRSLIEKLEAMATQTEQSPREAELARNLLSKLSESARTAESTRVLSREDVLAAPDRNSRGVVVEYRINGRWVRLDSDEADLIVRFTDFGKVP